MVRISDIEISLDFYCTKLGLIEKSRYDDEKGRFTNIFLYAPENAQSVATESSPLLELTYNWPDTDGNQELYTKGRNFGHLAFEVQNIHEICQELMDNGVTIHRPPRDGRMAFILSPDGISIELLQKGAALEPLLKWVTMENVGSW